MKKILILSVCLSMTGFYGCASKKGTGAGIGAGAGAAIGAGIGAIVGGKKGAVIGAGAGAAAGSVTGAVIGKRMDEQQAELDKIEAAKVERVADNAINVKFDSGILFDVGSANLKAEAQAALGNFAQVLTQYPDNSLTIEGHTDSTGKLSTNQRLSEKRASSVKSYLMNQGVAPSQMITQGYADAKPVASNDTAEGKLQNRRVEVIIVQEVPVEATESTTEGSQETSY